MAPVWQNSEKASAVLFLNVYEREESKELQVPGYGVSELCESWQSMAGSKFLSDKQKQVHHLTKQTVALSWLEGHLPKELLSSY